MPVWHGFARDSPWAGWGALVLIGATMRPFWLLETQIASTAACRPQVVGAEGGGLIVLIWKGRAVLSWNKRPVWYAPYTWHRSTLGFRKAQVEKREVGAAILQAGWASASTAAFCPHHTLAETGEVNLVLKGKVIFCQALSFFLQNMPFNTNRDPA